MLKKVMIILLVFAVGTFVYFAIADKNYAPELDRNNLINEQEDKLAEDEYPKPETNHVQEQISYMTLDEKIGQLFIAGLEGTTLTDHERDKFERNALGGAILFKNNLKTPEQSIQLINELKMMETMNEIPLFLSVDQEGGRVTRLPGLSPLKSAEEIGDVNDPLFAFKNGQLVGRHLRKFGFQVDFAPVLDINSNPENTVIGDRAFGDNAELVTEMGIKMMEGLQGQDVISAVKHFPGHGDTTADSHIDLPVINKTREELDEQEFIPFKEAVEEGTDMVLVAHILLPELGADSPASMSRPVINILRDEWQYNGVIITDDLTMGAIMDNYSMEEAVVKSFQAGVDIMLIAHGEENIDEGIKALKKAVNNGVVSEESIDESVSRVLHLKQKYHLNNDPVGKMSIYEMNEEIREVYDE